MYIQFYLLSTIIVCCSQFIIIYHISYLVSNFPSADVLWEVSISDEFVEEAEALALGRF